MGWSKALKKAWKDHTNDEEFSGFDEVEEAFAAGWNAAIEFAERTFIKRNTDGE